MLMMKQDDEELALITNQMVEDDLAIDAQECDEDDNSNEDVCCWLMDYRNSIFDRSAISEPKDEADIWLDEYLHRFYDKNKNDEL